MLYAAISPVDRKDEVISMLENMYDLPVISVSNFVTLTLTPSNQIIHPARIYGVFKEWDGKKA